MAKKTQKKAAKRVVAKKSAKKAPKKAGKKPVKKSAKRSLVGSFKVYCDKNRRFVRRHLTEAAAVALAKDHCSGAHSIEVDN